MKCEECTNSTPGLYGFTFCLNSQLREVRVEWNEDKQEYECDCFNQK